MHVLYVPLTPMVTARVLEELTRPPVVEEAWTAPVQSGVPAGRRTRVSPGDAKLPRTLRVVCVFGATVEGENPTSGGDGGGDGGDGGGDGGHECEHTRQPVEA
jgi:hypothetical protein